MMSLEDDAKTLAEIIYKTKVEERGELFLLIAIELRSKSQYATASMMLDLANAYGYKEQS